MELAEYIASKIRQLRENPGGERWSQEALANAVGTTANTISRWETGTYKPSIEDLEKLAKFFRVSILTFFPSDGEQQVNEELGALLRAAKQLGRDDLEELRRYAEFRKARNLYSRSKQRPRRKGEQAS